MERSTEDIRSEMETLPRGTIVIKKINGKEWFYRQWTEQGKSKSQYIRRDDVETVRKQIARRKELQAILKERSMSPLSIKQPKAAYESYAMNVKQGVALRALTQQTASLQTRDCFQSIQTFLRGKVTPRVCALYGLRRTGKTTLLYQAAASLSPDDFEKAVYIKARQKDTMSMLTRDLDRLWAQGIRFVFIDEITFLEDFIDTASVLSDLYAGMGMKIILSGTDSLGLWLASREELYDRVYLLHTTWISYAEHSRLLGIDDVDEYIRYGGTLRAGETDFDDPALQSEDISFRDNESTRRYIDTAICKNIQHSLRCYENGTRFMHLQELYDCGELTGAINRIVESMNHRFVLQVLTERFRSSDFQLERKNLLKEKNPALRTDIPEKVNREEITAHLMRILEIRNQTSDSLVLTQSHANEIKEYLKALDLIDNCPIHYASETEKRENILLLQPGMRFCQAQALVYSLKDDPLFTALTPEEKNYVCEKILDEVRGRMLEEIVLAETGRYWKNDKEVFKFRFVGGEFDMVIQNRQTAGCDIFEIKHSRESTPEQCRHLLNPESCAKLEQAAGPVTGRYVLYRGPAKEEENGVIYLNVEDYLKNPASLQGLPML